MKINGIVGYINGMSIYINILIWLMVLVDRRMGVKKRRPFSIVSKLHLRKGVLDNVSQYIGQICMGTGIVIIIYMIFFASIQKKSSIMNVIIGNANDIENMGIAFSAIVITILIFAIELGEKDYYLCITKEDIVKHYYIDWMFLIMCSCIVISLVIVQFLCAKLNDLSVIKRLISAMFGTIWCIILMLGTSLLFLVWRIIFRGKEATHFSLKNFYQKLWSSDDIIITNENAIDYNLMYFVEDYVNQKCIVKGEYKNISVIKYYWDALNEEEWYKNAKGKLIKFLFVLIVLCVFRNVLFGCLTKIFKSVWVVGIISIGSCVISIILISCCKKDYVKATVLGATIDRSGYEIIRKKGKNKYIGTVTFIQGGQYRNYIKSIQNLLAFYRILCMSKDKKFRKMVGKSFVDLEIYLDEFAGQKKLIDNQSGFLKAVYYLPLFVCGYLFKDNKKIKERLRSKFKTFNLDEDEKDKYFEMLNGFILESYRFRPTKKDKKSLLSQCDIEKYCSSYIGTNGYTKIFED